ncbi:MAG: vanadium-dependent haloperoxidase [Bacteroidota bacterium]
MRSYTTSTATLLFFTILSVFLINCTDTNVQVEEYGPEVLLAWNEKVMALAVAEDGLLTLKGLRTTTMMHLAAHDALNSLVPQYRHYSYTAEAVEAHPIATAAHALYAIAVTQYPNHKPELHEALEHCLDALPKARIGAAKVRGEAAAAKLLDRRQGDAWNGEAEYTLHPMAPGVYAEFNKHSGTPEGFVFGAGWAKAQPFMLTASDHFRSPPPPEINSPDYTEAFNEVKEVGATESTTRTADQTHLAAWWKDFVENSHNRLARDLVLKEQLNLWEGARALALMNMAVYDGYVNVFDNKFHYNHWRPFTAIRWAAHDDNPDTLPDTAWNNLHQHTYPFPSYPSAHGTASSAAMRVLATTLGTGDTYAFTMTTPEVDKTGPFSGKLIMDPPTRSFNSFSEAGWEASISRVYLGIHFRYDSEEGHRLGTTIGEYAVHNFLQPLPQQ